ncbi:MAG: c-type cytochrome [Anaerolineae bacterium]|nr:c-type cytochrome [Anaerolineae bacterium]
MMRNAFAAKLTLVVLVMLLTGCSANDALGLLGIRSRMDTSVTPITGDATRGEAIFKTGVGDAPACTACHAMKQGPFSIGPALKGIYERAKTRVPGLTAEQYLRQSILDPKAYIAPGFRPIMYPDYAAHLSEQQVADLIAYLSTL